MGGPIFIGEPIWAHRLLLRCGSERFRAYMERWEQPAADPGPSGRKSPSASQAAAPSTPVTAQCAASNKPDSNEQEQNRCQNSGGADSQTPGPANTTMKASGDDDADPAAPRKRPRPSLATSPTAPADASPSTPCPSGRLPELRVPLGREDELPAARRALRFLYAGSVPHGVGFKDLLATRRLGAYLQIDGCAAACDAAMVRKLEEECPGCSAVVLDAYACWYAFPDDPSFGRVLAACARFLVAHFRDAPSVLNSRPEDPASLLRQFTSLPPPALEALLAAHDFATDSESSVLLLLAHWRDLNPFRPLRRACRLIRVMHLSPAYLRHVLPVLPWFEANPHERTALLALASTSNTYERTCLLSSAAACGVSLGPGTNQDWESAEREQQHQSQSGYKWLAPPRRRCQLGCIRAVAWSVSSDELARTARQAARVPLVSASHTRRMPVAIMLAGATGAAAAAAGGGSAPAAPPPPSYVIAHGLRWDVTLGLSRLRAPRVSLVANLPAVFGPSAGLHDLQSCPISVGIQRSTAADHSPGVYAKLPTQHKCFAPFNTRVSFWVGSDAEVARVAAAAAAAGTDPDLMDPFAPYVQPDRTVRGTLCFEDPDPPLPTRLTAAAPDGRRGGGRRGGIVRQRDEGGSDGEEELDGGMGMEEDDEEEDMEELMGDEFGPQQMAQMAARLRALQRVVARQVQGDAALRG